MRILSVIPSMDLRTGGPAESLRNLSALLISQGHVSHIASCDREDADVETPGLSTFNFPPRLGAYRYSEGLSRWLDANIRNYDAVLVHGLWQYPGVAVRKAALKAGVPYWVLTHGMLDPYFNKASPLKKTKKGMYWPLQHRVLADAQSVLFTAEDEKLLARQSFSPYQVRETVIPYGTVHPPENLKEQKQAFEEHFGKLAGKRFVLFLGRLHPKKGGDLLIRAFAKMTPALPDLQLVLAGPDSNGYSDLLRSIVREEGIADKVHFPGMVMGAAKWGLLRSADLFALTSHQENFGVAVAEALACGVPVLITKRVNIWREVLSSGAGLAPEDNQEEVSEAFRQWCSLTETDRKRSSELALAAFDKHFRLERTCDALIKEFSRVQRPPAEFTKPSNVWAAG